MVDSLISNPIHVHIHIDIALMPSRHIYEISLLNPRTITRCHTIMKMFLYNNRIPDFNRIYTFENTPKLPSSTVSTYIEEVSYEKTP